jgi:hypothetical protein
MNKDNIKSTILSAGWKDIEAIFREEILEGRKAVNYNTNGKDYQTIAVETMAREKAAKTLEKILKRINGYKSDPEIKKESFK